MSYDDLYRDHLRRLRRDYDRALADAGYDGVVIHSGTALAKSRFDDQYWPLRPVPHFQHWLPLAEADCALLVLAGREPVLLRNVETSYWEGRPAPESDHFWDGFEVVDVEGAAGVGARLPAGKKLAFVGDDLGRADMWALPADVRNPAPLTAALDALRSVKSAYEIECMAEANRRAAAGHERVLEAFAEGDYSELQLHLTYLEATRQDDAETPYKNIVALGEHAATLHHVHYGRAAAADARSLLLDAGATCNGYHADITRTASKGTGAAAQTFGALIERIEALQQEMCRRVERGVPYQQLHNQCHELLADVLRDIGLGKASADELVHGGVTRKFLPHGLGHSLGVQTHDVGCARVAPDPDNPFLRNTSIIEDGQVFTIEPGCYFIPSLLDEVRGGPHAASVDWALVDRLAEFGGIRIEDDIAVVDGGARNLTREVL